MCSILSRLFVLYTKTVFPPVGVVIELGNLGFAFDRMCIPNLLYTVDVACFIIRIVTKECLIERCLLDAVRGTPSVETGITVINFDIVADIVGAGTVVIDINIIRT